jgi:hypothetical protein
MQLRTARPIRRHPRTNQFEPPAGANRYAAARRIVTSPAFHARKIGSETAVLQPRAASIHVDRTTVPNPLSHAHEIPAEIGTC